MTEAAIQRAIRERLGKRKDVWLERRPGGLVKPKGGTTIRLGRSGVPDLTGSVKIMYRGWFFPVWIGIEVKRPGKKQRPSQVAFQAALERRHAGYYLLATSADEAEQLVDALIARLERR